MKWEEGTAQPAAGGVAWGPGSAPARFPRKILFLRRLQGTCVRFPPRVAPRDVTPAATSRGMHGPPTRGRHNCG
jgi:hypothetical protein